MSLIYATNGATTGPLITVEISTNPPSPSAVITLENFGAPDTILTIWRTSDGTRLPVRGARRRRIIDGDVITDYEIPLGRELRYEVEVLSGDAYGVDTGTTTVLAESDNGYIQDPLDPSTAIPLLRSMVAGRPTLASGAFAELQYQADVSTHTILGSSNPVALIGQRMAATGVPFSVLTDAAEQNTALRDLLKVPVLLVRPHPSWGSFLPAVSFIASPTVSEQPIGAPHGQTITQWDFTADIVAAPSINIIVALFTYQDVSAMYQTYTQAQDAFAASTYLDVQKGPAGA